LAWRLHDSVIEYFGIGLFISDLDECDAKVPTACGIADAVLHSSKMLSQRPKCQSPGGVTPVATLI